jgi:hypothetical protein
VVRGGSWNNNQDNARAADRNRNNPHNSNNNNGVRLASHDSTDLAGNVARQPTLRGRGI